MLQYWRFPLSTWPISGPRSVGSNITTQLELLKPTRLPLRIAFWRAICSIHSSEWILPHITAVQQMPGWMEAAKSASPNIYQSLKHADTVGIIIINGSLVLVILYWGALRQTYFHLFSQAQRVATRSVATRCACLTPKSPSYGEFWIRRVAHTWFIWSCEERCQDRQTDSPVVVVVEVIREGSLWPVGL